MSNQYQSLPPMGKSKKKPKKYLAVIIVLAVTIGLLFLMVMLKPAVEKKEDAEVVPVVEVININPIDFTIPIKTEGVVLPKRAINFSAEIVGKIVYVAEQFSNGGKFNVGDVLLKVDPRDYELAITRAQANVSASMASLDLEQAKSDLARDDWKKYGKKGKPSALNLNLPQVASAKAALAGAKADLALAKRNLEKTSIIAPFDGVILTKNVDLGQFVNVGSVLASIASTQMAEIRVALSDKQLIQSGLDQALENDTVQIKSEETSDALWQGQVVRIEAQRDARTLMNYVIVEVKQPFSQQSIPLRFNTFVEVVLAGETLSEVYPLARNFMLLNNRVKIFDAKSQLKIIPVEVVYADDFRFYISKGITQKDRIITTQLPTTKSGAELKLAQTSRD